MAGSILQYVSDEKGKPVSVIVPLKLWRTIEAERETAYLLKSPAMKRRLLQAKRRRSGVTLEDALAKLDL
jgi:PHD/YefM family antitoxin component YafN of YafNO toxin-antitoxin module